MISDKAVEAGAFGMCTSIRRAECVCQKNGRLDTRSLGCCSILERSRACLTAAHEAAPPVVGEDREIILEMLRDYDGLILDGIVEGAGRYTDQVRASAIEQLEAAAPTSDAGEG